MAVNRGKGMLFGGVVAGIVVIVVAAVSAGMLDGLFKKSPAETAKAAGVVETVDAVRIPLTALDSGKALFLSLASDDRQIHYFALKSRDGAYRAAFDACDVCFKSNRGYRQEGDLMVCNNCGQAFPSNKIAEIKGGCNPHPLARGIEGQHLVIKRTDIVAGREYFAGRRT